MRLMCILPQWMPTMVSMSSSINTSLPPTAVCLSGSVSNADMAIE